MTCMRTFCISDKIILTIVLFGVIFMTILGGIGVIGVADIAERKDLRAS